MLRTLVMSRYAKLKGTNSGQTSSGANRYAPLVKRKIIPDVGSSAASRHDFEARRRRLEPPAYLDILEAASPGSSPLSPSNAIIPPLPPSPAASSSSWRSAFSETGGGIAGVYAAEIRHAQLKHHWSDRSLETFIKLTKKFLEPCSRGLHASLYHLQQLEEGFSYCFGQIVYCCKFCGDPLDTDTSLCTSGGNCKGRFKPDTQLSCAMANLDIQAQLERIVAGSINDNIN